MTGIASEVKRCRWSAGGRKYLASLGRSLVIGTCRVLPGNSASTSLVPCPAVTTTDAVPKTPALQEIRRFAPSRSMVETVAPSWTTVPASARPARSAPVTAGRLTNPPTGSRSAISATRKGYLAVTSSVVIRSTGIPSLVITSVLSVA